MQNYLSIVSRFFFIAYNTGYLKSNRIYYCHYFVKNLIKKGDKVIDIGANLGYYSVIFAKLVGDKGKVYAVEPVSFFRKVLTGNVSRYKNVEIVPYALGKFNNKKVKMGIPLSSGHLKHGRTHIIDELKKDDCLHVSEATMYTPSALFGNLKRLDYIKCDIEGFELEVIPEFSGIISRFHPIVQIETADDSHKLIFEMMINEGYKAFYVYSLKLLKIEKVTDYSYGDSIFIHASAIDRFSPELFAN